MTKQEQEMFLKDKDRDGFIDVLNIALGRAAASFSELTRRRVEIKPPQVNIFPISKIAGPLQDLAGGEVAAVHQVFSGPVAGDAFLLLSYPNALKLVNLLTDSGIPEQQLKFLDNEVLMEVGNILLNACLGMFGDLLKVHVTFTAPSLHLGTVEQLMDPFVIRKAGLQCGLLVTMSFYIREVEISGYIVFVSGAASLERLIQAVEQV